jgi:hypothetical protein
MSTFKGYDAIIAEEIEDASLHDKSPFVSHDLDFVDDLNKNGNYRSSNGGCFFESELTSVDGKWSDHRNDFIAIPLVIVVDGTTPGVDAIPEDEDTEAVPAVPEGPVDFSRHAGDTMIAFKNSVYNLIENYSIQFDGGEVIQRSGLSNAYINFMLNSEMSSEDERIYGENINYKRDTPTSWQYHETESPSGIGMTNNRNHRVEVPGDSIFTGGNLGMLKRQQRFSTLDRPGQNLLFGAETTKYDAFNMNYIKNTSTHKEIHMTAIIPLRHLLFFESLPALRSAKIKLSLQINQCYFQFTKTEDGNITFDSTNTQITGGNTLPIMVAASESTYEYGGFLATTKGGTQCLPQGTYRVSCSIGQNRWTGHTNGTGVAHKISNCRWYTNKYMMSPEVESMLLEKTGNMKEVSYKDVNYHVINDFLPGSSRSFYVENSILNPIRLIVIPVLANTADSGNGETGSEFPVVQSPFTTEPATCSPHMFGDVQLRIGGRNVFPRPLNYKFETFMAELGRESRISQTDYENIYGYMVFDLKRRVFDQENKAVSVHLALKNYGLKSYDLHCFIEYEKSATINLYTGSLVSTMST